jgi:hypothetical protein
MTEKILLNFKIHGQMSVNTNILPLVSTFDRALYVYNIEMQCYGHMTVKHLFIIHNTGLLYVDIENDYQVEAVLVILP